MMKPDAIQRFEPFRPSQPEQVRARERKVEQAPPVRAAGRTGRRLLGLGALLILSQSDTGPGVIIRLMPT